MHKDGAEVSRILMEHGHGGPVLYDEGGREAAARWWADGRIADSRGSVPGAGRVDVCRVMVDRIRNVVGGLQTVAAVDSDSGIDRVAHGRVSSGCEPRGEPAPSSLIDSGARLTIHWIIASYRMHTVVLSTPSLVTEA